MDARHASQIVNLIEFLLSVLKSNYITVEKDNDLSLDKLF